jgi:hypothetical protein
MKQLRWAARVFVLATIAAGALTFAICVPRIHFAQPLLFIALLLLSSMSASLKVALPLTTSASTLSVSYAVDFASLLLLGPDETMLVAAGSAFSQCHFNSKQRNPLHRTLFSRSSLDDEAARVDDLEQQLPVERAELLRRRCNGGGGRVGGRARGLLGAARVRTDLPHLQDLQGVHGPHRRRAAARAANL